MSNFTNDAGTGYVDSDGYRGVVRTNGNPALPAAAPAPFPNGLIVTGGIIAGSTATGIVAHAGGGQANATLLPAQSNQVSTVATANDSVKAPTAATPGANFEALNSGANAMQLFGQGTDTINGVAAATGVSVLAGKTASLTCFTAGAWVGPLALV